MKLMHVNRVSWELLKYSRTQVWLLLLPQHNHIFVLRNGHLGTLNGSLQTLMRASFFPLCKWWLFAHVTYSRVYSTVKTLLWCYKLQLLFAFCVSREQMLDSAVFVQNIVQLILLPFLLTEGSLYLQQENACEHNIYNLACSV